MILTKFYRQRQAQKFELATERPNDLRHVVIHVEMLAHMICGFVEQLQKLGGVLNKTWFTFLCTIILSVPK